MGGVSGIVAPVAVVGRGDVEARNGITWHFEPQPVMGRSR
mgnify:CR=1 FL=1